MVRVWDSGTQSARVIPVSDLPAGYMQVRIQGLEGVFWVDAESLKPGALVREALPPQLHTRVLLAGAALAGALPMPHADWEQSFLRDADPETEITIWERIAAVFIQATAGRVMPDEKRRAICSLLVSFSTVGMPATTERGFGPHIDPDEFAAIVQSYRALGG